MSATQSYAIPNLFDPSTYFNLDLKTGVMRNRSGAKVITLSGYMLRGLYIGLKNETGPAWALIMRRCGEIWGERFAKRFLAEIGEFYAEDLNTMSMNRFNALVTELFANSGWGKVTLNYSLIPQGFVVAEVQSPIMGEVIGDAGERMDVLMEGIFKALFTQVAGKPMDCFQTQCVAENATLSLFVIGLASRMESVPEWLEAGDRHDAIITKLLKTTTKAS
jgi:predicted hydrocarbon binding protein